MVNQEDKYVFHEDICNYTNYQDAHFKVMENLCKNIVEFSKKKNYYSVLYLYDLLKTVDTYKIAEDYVCSMIIEGLYFSCKYNCIELIDFFIDKIDENEWEISKEKILKMEINEYNKENDDPENLNIISCIDACFDNNGYENLEKLLNKNIISKNDIDNSNLISIIAKRYNSGHDIHVELINWILNNFKLNKNEIKKQFKNWHNNMWIKFEKEYINYLI